VDGDTLWLTYTLNDVKIGTAARLLDNGSVVRLRLKRLE